MELEIYRTTLITLKNIEDFNREPRKALGRPDASDIICDNNTHFKVKLEISKGIGGAAKLLVWTDELEKKTEKL